MAEIKIAITDDDIKACWETIYILRPLLKGDEFVNKINTLQDEGYTLLYLSEKGNVVSVAGYRIMTMLYCGKMLYIDDLSTLESARGKGYASLLLNHLVTIAKQQHCTSIQLDSGHSRTKAHKLYFNEGFVINAFHFNKEL